LVGFGPSGEADRALLGGASGEDDAVDVREDPLSTSLAVIERRDDRPLTDVDDEGEFVEDDHGLTSSFGSRRFDGVRQPGAPSGIQLDVAALEAALGAPAELEKASRQLELRAEAAAGI